VSLCGYFLAKGYILRSNIQFIKRPLMSVTQSPTYPQSETRERAGSKTASYNKTNLEDLIESDLVVRMTPKKRYYVEMDVREVVRAKPNVLAPKFI
jgi:hypothetical protein